MSNLVKRPKDIGEAWRRLIQQQGEIERLEKEMTELATGNIERWERECAMANSIERLKAALRRSCQCGEGMYAITGEQCTACAILEGDDE